MVDDSALLISKQQRIAAWLVHLFTASGAVFGLLSLWAIHQGQLIESFWFMAGTIFIDSIDGILARRAQTKVAVPKVDGALLDNMVDYFTYVIVPAFFLLATGLLPVGWAPIGASVIILASAYQFTQAEAKTEDHFFKGFPSYWNIIAFYLFMLQLSPWANLLIIFILVVLIFVPIKYIYPSRLDYLTPNIWLRRGVLAGAILWGIACLAILMTYPHIHPIFIAISLGYGAVYVVISLYRNFVPIEFPESDLE